MAIIQNPDVQTIKALPCHVLFEKNILVGEDNSLPRIYELYAFVDPVPEKPADHHLPDMEPDFFFEKDFDIAVLGLKISPNEGLLREPNLHFISLREYFSYHNEDEVFKAARARALFEWKSKNHYCSNCGKRLFLLKDLTALECSRCNLQYFPRIEPCVIVLVRRGEEMLLARHAQRNQDIYACIAGFIEAGETAEQAVHREVFEETGVKYEIDRLAVIHENFFCEKGGTLKNRDCHEIALYFIMKPRGTKELNSNSFTQGVRETMHWISIKDLDKYKAYPSFMKEYLQNEHCGIEHIVTDERE